MSKLLEQILNERRSYPLGNRPGYPVFHSVRAPYRKSVDDRTLEKISAMVHSKWPEFTFKLNSNQSMVTVGVYQSDELVDHFKFSNRDYTDMSMIVSPEGVFEPEIPDFMGIVKRVMD